MFVYLVKLNSTFSIEMVVETKKQRTKTQMCSVGTIREHSEMK